MNAAGLRYRSLLKQWTTHDTLSPTYTDQSEAFFESRGFVGDYDVVLQLPNGPTTTQKFSLNPGNEPLIIQLHLPGKLDCGMLLKIYRMMFLGAHYIS